MNAGRDATGLGLDVDAGVAEGAHPLSSTTAARAVAAARGIDMR
jgi:hypothetical protein